MMEEAPEVIMFGTCSHEGSDPRLFCRTCKKLICDDCIISREHADHFLDKIQNADQLMEIELQERITEVEEKIPSLQRKFDEYKNKRETYDDRMNKINELARLNFSRSVEVLKTEKDNLLKDIQDMKSTNANRLQRAENETETALSKCEAFKYEAEKYIKRRKAGDSGKIGEVRFPAIVEPEDPDVTLPSLIFEELPKETARKAVGILKTATRASRKSSVFESFMPQMSSSEEISIIARDRYLTTGITAICPVDTVRAWVTRADNLGCIDLVSFESNRIKVEKTMEIDQNRIDDLAINNTGDLLIVVRNNPMIRMLRHGRRGVTTFTDVSPYIPFGLCVTQDDNVLISAAKASDDGSFKGTILDLNDAGKLTRHLDLKDESGVNVQLHLPRKVRETSEKTVVILECVELTEPKVFIATSEGHILRVINGRENNFASVGICCDLTNRVVIADRKSNSLIFADQTPDGPLDRHVVDKMYDPWCLAPSIDGKIWIGCGNSYVMIIAAGSDFAEESTYSNVFQ